MWRAQDASTALVSAPSHRFTAVVGVDQHPQQAKSKLFQNEVFALKGKASFIFTLVSTMACTFCTHRNSSSDLEPEHIFFHHKQPCAGQKTSGGI
ncbi:hypothetical protein SDJN03_13949, partial [Cucurbita argyrosperma subsp. sororia]